MCLNLLDNLNLVKKNTTLSNNLTTHFFKKFISYGIKNFRQEKGNNNDANHRY